MTKKSKRMSDRTAKQIYRWCAFVAQRSCIVKHTAYDADDLSAIGFIGALKAYPRWDKNKGGLSTFLKPRIKGAIQDYIRDFHKYRAVEKGIKSGNSKSNYVLFSSIEAKLTKPSSDDLLIDTKAEDFVKRMEDVDEINKWAAKNSIIQKELVILYLRYGYEMSLDAIGKIIGVTEASVSIKLKGILKNITIEPIRCVAPHKQKKKKGK